MPHTGFTRLKLVTVLATAGVALPFAHAEALSTEGKQVFVTEFRNRYQDRLDEDYTRLLSEPSPTVRLAKVDEKLNAYQQDSGTLASMINDVVTPLFEGVTAYEKSFFADPWQYEDPSRAKMVLQYRTILFTPAFIKAIPQAKDCKVLHAKAQEARLAYVKGREKLHSEAARFLDESCGKQLQQLEKAAGDCSIGKALTSDPTNFLGMAVGGGSALQLGNKNVAILSEYARLGCNQARSMWREHVTMIKKATDLEAAVKAVQAQKPKPVSEAFATGATKKAVADNVKGPVPNQGAVTSSTARSE